MKTSVGMFATAARLMQATARGPVVSTAKVAVNFDMRRSFCNALVRDISSRKVMSSTSIVPALVLPVAGSLFHTTTAQQGEKKKKKWVDASTIIDRYVVPDRNTLRRGGQLTPEAVCKVQSTIPHIVHGKPATRWVRDPDTITAHKGLFEYAGDHRLYRIPKKGCPIQPKPIELLEMNYARNKWKRFMKKRIFVETERYLSREQKHAARQRKRQKKKAEYIALEQSRVKWAEYVEERIAAGVVPKATIKYNKQLHDYRGMFKNTPAALGRPQPTTTA
mmetsp:Transcript_41380/g.50168  ORF Transcript_41380/g.50168 Transcript_41380/m.50168 type:complete len:277 (-) Transcript_41380:272-1102(-)|eukprot:CAMPEP_0197844178 /NCGR_PEP_ID=MMETSP1438-20131217/1162_1 /TAXON_ID=1461541 /ORGANISM="Pterosperma sp., Strain CCMP1384" /LENGTH=276 /DNA_ID=CAMNT_0043454823 /DNA_START=108 /DNA_END=938 /DNA_ORIENTATION=+